MPDRVFTAPLCSFGLCMLLFVVGSTKICGVIQESRALRGEYQIVWGQAAMATSTGAGFKSSMTRNRAGSSARTNPHPTLFGTPSIEHSDG